MEGMGFGEAGFWEAYWQQTQNHNNKHEIKEQEARPDAPAAVAVVEWYEDYYGMKPLLDKHLAVDLRRGGRFLCIGCGNSLLAEQMVADGYCQEEGSVICSIDFSPSVIAEMKKRENERVKYQVADVCDLSGVIAEDHTVGVILDKGCLDSILSRSDSWMVVEAMSKELHRVLRVKRKKKEMISAEEKEGEEEKDGMYIVVSVEDRTELFQRCGWKVVCVEKMQRRKPLDEAVAPNSEYFFLIMKPTLSS